jgi:hypothetical protein
LGPPVDGTTKTVSLPHGLTPMTRVALCSNSFIAGKKQLVAGGSSGIHKQSERTHQARQARQDSNEASSPAE